MLGIKEESAGDTSTPGSAMQEDFLG
jgi:hypothetical protein